MQITRHALYWMPEDGAFARAAALWLGWDALAGEPPPPPLSVTYYLNGP